MTDFVRCAWCGTLIPLANAKARTALIESTGLEPMECTDDVWCHRQQVFNRSQLEGQINDVRRSVAES